MEYEPVHEIRNRCPNNRVRDIFIGVVRRCQDFSLFDGLRHEFSFH